MLTFHREKLEAVLEAKPDKCTSCPADFDTLEKRIKAGKYYCDEQCLRIYYWGNLSHLLIS